jgi:hypothetical protein
LDKRETGLIAQEIVTLLPRGEEEKDLQEDVTNIARMIRGKLSKIDALDMATKGARRKNEGETNKTACGDFFALCKQKWDPLHQLYMKQSCEIYFDHHVPLLPRKYQEEMAKNAISCKNSYQRRTTTAPLGSWRQHHHMCLFIPWWRVPKGYMA